MTAGALVLAWAIGVFGVGALTIGAYAFTHPGKARELWLVYASTLGIAAALLVPLALSPLLFALVAAAAAYRCALELGTTYRTPPRPLGHAIGLATVAAAVAIGASHEPRATMLLYVATAALIVLTGPLYIRAFSVPPRGLRATVLALAFPCLAAAHLAHMANGLHGFAWVFVVYATVETQDSAAYLAGRLFGRRLLLPRLSPKKTVVGAAAGMLCGLLVGTLAATALLDLSAGASLALAALAALAGFCGDLFTSALKRGAGVKDFPAVLRLHGGVLDIYDSTLFAAVVVSSTIYIIAQ